MKNIVHTSRSSTRHLLPYLATLIAPLLLALHFKYTILTMNGGGYEVLSERNKEGLDHLSWADKMWPFIGDILVSGLLIPIVLLLLLRVVPQKSRPFIAIFASFFLTLVLFIELKCFWEVGTFLPFSVLIAGLTATGRQFLAAYLPLGSILKLTSLLLLTIIVAILASRHERKRSLLHSTHNNASRLTPIAIGATLFLSLGFSSFSTTTSEYNASTAAISLKSFLSNGHEAVQEKSEITPQELMDEYRRLVNAPAHNPYSEYWGKAKNYDVIFIQLETCPASILSDGLEQLPNIQSLLPNSFNAALHYSTYPYTTRALFAIYSSLYDSNLSSDFIRMLTTGNHKLTAPGVVRSLHSTGYRTAIFQPDHGDNWERDRERYDALGFKEQYYADASAKDQLPRSNSEWHDLAKEKDRFLLTRFKKEMQQSIESNQRYLFAFHPQYSHAPWPDVTPNSSLEEVLTSGRKLFTIEDGWIGEIITLLRSKNRLDKTLIVIVGDHGIRTKTEHSGFNTGKINDVTFHVPLIIYAPHVVPQETSIPWLTSHIDIAPTILDLLGVSEGRMYEQGTAIWNSTLQNRTTFFFARNYSGLDGYYENSRIYMQKKPFNTVYSGDWSGQLHFESTDRALSSSPLQEEVGHKISQITSLQEALVKKILVE